MRSRSYKNGLFIDCSSQSTTVLRHISGYKGIERIDSPLSLYACCTHTNVHFSLFSFFSFPLFPHAHIFEKHLSLFAPSMKILLFVFPQYSLCSGRVPREVRKSWAPISSDLLSTQNFFLYILVVTTDEFIDSYTHDTVLLMSWGKRL